MLVFLYRRRFRHGKYWPYRLVQYGIVFPKIDMIDMANIETRMRADKRYGKQARQQANKQKGKQISKQTKRGVHEGQMQVWIGCPQLHWVEVWMTHQQARLMRVHVRKRIKMHIKPTGGTNKYGKHNIARSGKRERYARSNRQQGDASQMVTSK